MVLTAVVVAAPAAAYSATPLAPTPVGSIGIRLLDAPVALRDDPRARVYVVDHLAPGSVIQRRVEVSNTTRATAQIALYSAAAIIANGTFLAAAGHAANDLSTWTSVRPGASEIPADGKMTATVTIRVPPDAAPGEQYGVVWAEARSTPQPGGGVIQVSRVGIRLYVSVGPGGPPAAGFAIDSLTAQRSPDGRPMVLATVRNTGGRALDMNGTLRLSAGPGGLSAGPFAATLGTTLAIGDTEPVTIVLDKRVPDGPWDARVTLHSGLLERSARATVTFPVSGASLPVTTRSARPGWLYPTGLLALLVLSIGSGIVLRWRRRYRAVPWASSSA